MFRIPLGFRRHGADPAAAKMDNVAEQVSVSKDTVCLYFESKEVRFEPLDLDAYFETHIDLILNRLRVSD